MAMESAQPSSVSETPAKTQVQILNEYRSEREKSFERFFELRHYSITQMKEFLGLQWPDHQRPLIVEVTTVGARESVMKLLKEAEEKEGYAIDWQRVIINVMPPEEQTVAFDSAKKESDQKPSAQA